MLYDPKWEVKANPFSLDSLIAWLEKQPADTRYDYTFPAQCMVAQYLQAHGVAGYCLDSFELEDKAPGWNKIAQGPLGHHWTFGAALDRARAHSRTQPRRRSLRVLRSSS